MDHQLDYQKAPKFYLQTWEGMKGTIVYSTISIIVILAALAFFFGG